MIDQFRTAKLLGLRAENYIDPVGSLVAFGRGTLLAQLWGEFNTFCKHECFEELKDVLDHLGPCIWKANNYDNVLHAGEVPEYPRELRWPDDKADILETFRDLYNERALRYGRRKSTAVRHGQVPKRKRAIDEDPEASRMAIGLFNSVATSSHSSNRTTHSASISSLAQDTYPIVDDLPATRLWLTTIDGHYSASLCLGKHQTIEELFAAIDMVFTEQAECISEARELGQLQKICMMFTNLGPAFEEVRVLGINDDDTELKRLRWEMDRGCEQYRGPHSMVIGRTTAFFEHDGSAVL